MAVDEIIIQDPSHFDQGAAGVDGQQEPLSNFASVRKNGDNSFTVVHKTDEEKNMQV